MKPIPGGVTKVTHVNAKVNGPHGKVLGGGSPKDTSRGMDLSGDATNCIDKNPSLTQAESPTAKAASYTNKERHG